MNIALHLNSIALDIALHIALRLALSIARSLWVYGEKVLYPHVHLQGIVLGIRKKKNKKRTYNKDNKGLSAWSFT